MLSLKEQVSLVSIRSMYKRGRFDIKVVERICDLMDVPPVGEEYDTLRMLHQARFSDMPSEVFDAVPELLGQLVATGGRRLKVTFENDQKVIEMEMS